MSQSVFEEQVQPKSEAIFGILTFAIAHMIPDFFAGKTQRDMWRCGYLHPQAYENYLALRNFLLVGVILISACWIVALDENPVMVQIVVIAGAVVAIVVFAAPRVYLSIRGESRAHRVVTGLPDSFDLIAMAMRGGLSFQRGVEHAVRELFSVHPDLAQEFALISRHAAADSLEYALRRFSQRIDQPASTSVAESLIQAIRLGSPMRSILETTADQMRRERMQRANEKANKNALKMLFPTVLCLAPAALIVVLLPPLMKLREFRAQANEAGGPLYQRDLGQVSPNKQTNQARTNRGVSAPKP